MLFATEFPVKTSVDRATFVAQSIAWVRGMEQTTLFGSNTDLTTLSDEAMISSPSGEKLVLKECRAGDVYMCGVRHEINDGEGRTWRSEVTLRNDATAAAVRSKTQCIIASETGKLQLPRKPYFITMAIEDGWTAPDGPFEVSRDPIHLHNHDISLATAVVTGASSNTLPAVYISRLDDHSLPLSEGQISALSNRLAGVAHIVVEPSRRFSLQLMGRSLAKNPYLGAIGVCVSGFGVVNKYFVGHVHRTADDLFHAVYNTVARYVSNRLPKLGVDWVDIVDESARQFRAAAESNQFDADAWFALRDEENAEKDAEIANLRMELERIQSESMVSASAEVGFVSRGLLESFGPELYPGELADRIRKIIVSAAEGQLAQLDTRSLLVARHVAKLTRWSGGASQLEARIKSAGKDSDKADARLGEILRDIGFVSRKNGGHPIYIADSLQGVPQQTLSSSSSDYRAGRNAASQMIRDLGLTDLRD